MSQTTIKRAPRENVAVKEMDDLRQSADEVAARAKAGAAEAAGTFAAERNPQILQQRRWCIERGFNRLVRLSRQVAVERGQCLRAIDDQRAEERGAVGRPCQRVAAIGQIGAHQKAGVGHAAGQGVGRGIADHGIRRQRPRATVDQVEIIARQARWL